MDFAWKRRHCSPVVEVHGVRLADDGADESGEGNSNSGEIELHSEGERRTSPRRMMSLELGVSRWLDALPSSQARSI